MKERCIIAAVDNNNAIGYKGDLLYKIPGDLVRFRKLTTGNIVIMGRKTYESIGKPLPNRHNIVVTSKGVDFPPEGSTIIQVKTLEDAYKVAEKLDGEKVYVIGGGQLYEAAMPYTQTIELTEILDEAPSADAYFPSDFTGFVCEYKTDYAFGQAEQLYRFATYKRVPTVE